MGVTVHQITLESYNIKKFFDTGPGFVFFLGGMIPNSLYDLISNTINRIQRVHCTLWNQCDFGPKHLLPEFFF